MKSKKPKQATGGLVYSTSTDWQDISRDEDAQSLSPSHIKQDLRIRVENNRGGKKATIISKYLGSQDSLENLCRELKIKCSTGGAVKDGEIILNGDLRQKVADLLTKLGYKYKFSGG